MFSEFPKLAGGGDRFCPFGFHLASVFFSPWLLRTILMESKFWFPRWLFCVYPVTQRPGRWWLYSSLLWKEIGLLEQLIREDVSPGWIIVTSIDRIKVCLFAQCPPALRKPSQLSWALDRPFHHLTLQQMLWIDNRLHFIHSTSKITSAKKKKKSNTL